jgi:hypothetical protein
MAVTQKPPIPRAFIATATTNDVGEKGLTPTEPWSRFFRDLRTDLDNTPRILPNASVSESDLNATVAATTLLTPEQDGLYLFQFYMAVMTADGVSSSVTPLLDWTQGLAKSHTFTAMTGNTTTTNWSEDYMIYADAGAPIRYTLTYASNTPAAMHFAFYAVLQSVAS